MSELRPASWAGDDARIAELEAELRSAKDALTVTMQSRVELEAEVERLRVRLRTVVTEWQLRCAALANGKKP